MAQKFHSDIQLIGSSTDLSLQDGGVIKLGTDVDFKIQHNGSNAFLQNYTGALYIDQNKDDGDIIFRSDDGSGGVTPYIRIDGSDEITRILKDFRYLDNVKANFGDGDDLRIYHNGTNSFIQNTTGDFSIENSTNDGNITFVSDDGSGGTATYIRIDGGTTESVFLKDARFIDSVKAKFGSSSDLQIYHDGSNSYVRDLGTGNLYIDTSGTQVVITTNATAKTAATFTNNGSVDLYYDNSKKFETTSAGTLTSGVSEATRFIATNGNMLQLHMSNWNTGNTDHYVLFNGWTSGTGDYVALKSSGNQNGSNGAILIADGNSGGRVYFGLHGNQQSAVDNATDPLATTYAYIGGSANYFSANTTITGTISNSQFTIPNTAGSAGQVLKWPSSGTTLEWGSGGGGIDGSGTANDIVMWSDSDTLTDAPIAISGNNATFAGQVIVQDNTSQPLSSLFEGTLVVQGSTSEDPIIAVTDINTANAAAGVFHQSSTSPGFPALVINAASNGSEQPLISARTNVSNTTGIGGTEVFAVDGDGDATFAGNVIITGSGTANSASLQIDNPSSSTFNHSIEAFAANLTNGESNVILVGKEGNTKNSGYLGYYWTASGSNNNFVSLGHWAADHLFRVYGDSVLSTVTLRSDVDMQAPIFYDKNDTSYYLNPNSTGTSLNAAGELIGSNINTFIKYLGVGVNYDTDRSTKVTDGVALYGAYNGGSNSPHTYDFSAQFVGNSRGFELSAAWHSQPALSIRTLRDCCSNWSSFYKIAIHGLNNSGGVLYASTYYDSNDTTYYLNPNGTGTSLNVAGSATFAGDLTVSGGDITLGGTGRIQGVDTVTDGTDAANKTYVDNHTYSHNHDDRYYTESESDGRFTSKDHIRSLGTQAFTAGSNPNITTAQLIGEIESDGGFDSYSSVFKTSWSYAGNYNLSDAGRFTETAGTSWITWTDNSNDSTRGNITALAIAPNTGGSAGKVFIYNDQGSSYAPGWREIWTNTSDGSGSGLDADTLDGVQGASYLRSDDNDTYNINNAAISLRYQVDDGAQIASGGSSQRFPLEVFANNGTDAAIAFHIASDYAGYFGLDGATNDLHWGGWSVGSSTKYRIWHQGNDGSNSGLDADLLDGQHASSFITTSSTQSNAIYIRNTSPTLYLRDTNHLSAMLHVNSNLIYFLRSSSNDSTSWATHASTAANDAAGRWPLAINITDSGNYFHIGSSSVLAGGHTVWHAGNDGPGSGLNADLLDGIGGDGYLRSNAADSMSAQLTMTGNNLIVFGPNSGWSKSLAIGGDANNSTSSRGSIGVTNGNLHIDAADGGYATYLNFYDGTGGVAFGNGAVGNVAWMGPDGDLWKGSSDNSGSKYWHAGNDGSGTGLDADTLDGMQTKSSNGASGANQILRTHSNGYLYHLNWIQMGNGTGLFYPAGVHFYETGNYMYSNTSLQAAQAMHAPIFYERGATGSYLDPSSTSVALSVMGQVVTKRPDSGICFLTNNTSATGYPTQFTISHDGGNVQLNNVRGHIKIVPQTIINGVLSCINTGHHKIGASGSGNLWIGGQTSGQYFRIHHNNSDTYLDANGGKIYFRGDSGANTRFEMDMTGSGAGTFTAGGDVVAYGSPSDRTLKKNIKPIENALDKVTKLKGVEFEWKEKGITNLTEDIGFIAQDVQEVLPKLVRENENGKLSMRHQGVIPVLVEAIKELKAEIEELKKQIK
jgi:hypothetical protein